MEGDDSYGSSYQFREMIGALLGTSDEDQKLGVSLLIDSNEILMRTFVEIVPYRVLGVGPEDRALGSVLKEKQGTDRGFCCFVLMKFSKPISIWKAFCPVLVM